MFVFTIKSKFSKKAQRITLCIALVFVCLFVATSVCAVVNSPKKQVVCEKGDYVTLVDSENDVDEFASQFSFIVGEKIYEKQVYIPTEFDKTFEEYNELQNAQGLDLTAYKGKSCSLCVYELENFAIDYKKMYMTILIHKGVVIGGHISDFESGSTVYTFFGD